MTFSEDNPPPIKKRDPFARMPLKEHRQFADELAALINKFSVETYSDTPDYILAEYLINCLDAFRITAERRDKWYGIKGLTERIADVTMLRIQVERDGNE